MPGSAASILYVIRSLEIGGAQRQLVMQAIGLRDRGFRVGVAVFYPGGALQDELERALVPVHSLRKRSWADFAGFGLRLARLVRRENPDVIYSFMTGANVLTALCRPFWGTRRLIWGIRASGIDATQYGLRRRLTIAASARLSSCPDLCVANSRVGAADYVEMGYPEKRMRVVPNGINTDKFAPRGVDGGRLRAGWRLAPNERAVGLVARLDPMKDHGTFLGAIAQLIEQGFAVRGVCAGTGPSDYEQALRQHAAKLGLDGRIEWIAQASDMPDLYQSLDVAVSASSFGEGFSNAIAEAMACGIPCVATDVGDSAEIVGSAGRVVPPRDMSALAAGIAELLRADKAAAASAARARVVDNFGISQMLDRTEQVIRGGV